MASLVGSRVERKEDTRFLQGKGRYTADINIANQTYAVFVRSPHARAKIKSVDTSKALKSSGVLGVLTGKEIAEDKIGGLIAGWAIRSEDGSEMKVPANPPLAKDGKLHPMQAAFKKTHGLQCGFCTPGMVMSAVDLLQTKKNPSDQEIREWLEGNICRCTGYQNIVAAVKEAATKM